MSIVHCQRAFYDLAMGHNGDTIRLMSVRAWLGDQSWFHITQYRLLPPDGVDMH